MAQIINSQKRNEKDINELWNSHRIVKSMIYGTHNRLVAKMESTLAKNDIHTDFTDVVLKD